MKKNTKKNKNVKKMSYFVLKNQCKLSLSKYSMKNKTRKNMS